MMCVDKRQHLFTTITELLIFCSLDFKKIYINELLCHQISAPSTKLLKTCSHHYPIKSLKSIVSVDISDQIFMSGHSLLCIMCISRCKNICSSKRKWPIFEIVYSLSIMYNNRNIASSNSLWSKHCWIYVNIEPTKWIVKLVCLRSAAP